MNEDKMPLFLINGFLEAGKTQFIKFTMQQDYFQTEGKTLLIVCEEGEEEYDEELLKQTHTAVVYIEEAEKLTPEYLQDLELLYNPERVLMEWNGMWNLDALKLPNDWDLYQQITIIDGSTFDLYLQNMKPLIGAMVRNTEMIIMNRCDEIEDLDVYRRTLKGMNPQVQIVFEDAEGEIEEVTEADLPFDVNAEVIEIPPEAYDEAVITSGGYERYFTDDDGTIYWHIMDPSTGTPAHSGLISVTIIGPCGLRCDGLSTALFVIGREKAAAHWAAHQDYEAVLVDESGTIWLTPGLKDRFIPVDQGETREIRIL